MTNLFVEFHDCTDPRRSKGRPNGHSVVAKIPMNFRQQASEVGIDLIPPGSVYSDGQAFGAIFLAENAMPSANSSAEHKIVVLQESSQEVCPTWADHLIAGRGSKGIKWALRFLSALSRSSWTRHQYGSHPDNYFWFSKGHNISNCPLVVLMHGGFWGADVALDHMMPLGTHLAQLGYSVVNLEARRGGDWTDSLEDITGALALVSRGAESLGATSNQVICVGHSSGAHLLYMALQKLEIDMMPKLMVSLGGLLDLEAAKEQTTCLVAIEQVEGRSDAPLPDPQEFEPKCPMLVVQGANDTTVPMIGKRTSFRKGSRRVQFLTAKGRDHMDLLKVEGALWSELSDRMRNASVI